MYTLISCIVSFIFQIAGSGHVNFRARTRKIAKSYKFKHFAGIITRFSVKFYAKKFQHSQSNIETFLINVPPCGIEPQPSEPESEILSIKL